MMKSDLCQFCAKLRSVKVQQKRSQTGCLETVSVNIVYYLEKAKKMFRRTVLLLPFNYYKYKNIQSGITNLNLFACKNLHSSFTYRDSKEVAIFENFESIKTKNKKTYLEMLGMFKERGVHRRGHVEFIYSALKNMESYGVHKDLQVYKTILDVLPKGKFIPTNIFQAEFMHYPKQQQCAIDLLEQMEDNGVMPDTEMEDILLNIFGRSGYPLRKYWRMMYWMPKFKNLSPWPLPEEISNDTFKLALLAVERISSVDIRSKVTVYQTKDIPEATDSTWIVSAQSEVQKTLLAEHATKKPIYVDGSFRIWIKNQPINYFILKSDPKPSTTDKSYDPDDVSNIYAPKFGSDVPPKVKLIPVPSVHEQEDAVIFSVCVTGTSTRDSLLSWVRHLERAGNSNLAVIPIVFTLRSPEKDVAIVENVAEDRTEDV